MLVHQLEAGGLGRADRAGATGDLATLEPLAFTDVLARSGLERTCRSRLSRFALIHARQGDARVRARQGARGRCTTPRLAALPAAALRADAAGASSTPPLGLDDEELAAVMRLLLQARLVVRAERGRTERPTVAGAVGPGRPPLPRAKPAGPPRRRLRRHLPLQGPCSPSAPAVRPEPAESSRCRSPTSTRSPSRPAATARARGAPLDARHDDENADRRRRGWASSSTGPRGSSNVVDNRGARRVRAAARTRAAARSTSSRSIRWSGCARASPPGLHRYDPVRHALVPLVRAEPGGPRA